MASSGQAGNQHPPPSNPPAPETKREEVVANTPANTQSPVDPSRITQSPTSSPPPAYPPPYSAPAQTPSPTPFQSPFQPPYQAPYQAPVQAQYQAPFQSPYQNPYQAPFQSPYQAAIQPRAQAPVSAPSPAPYQYQYQAPVATPSPQFQYGPQAPVSVPSPQFQYQPKAPVSTPSPTQFQYQQQAPVSTPSPQFQYQQQAPVTTPSPQFQYQQQAPVTTPSPALYQHQPQAPASAPSPVTGQTQYATPQVAPAGPKFTVLTKTSSLSSGFPYDNRLRELKISHDQWTQFSNDIVKASKLTKTEDIAAWTTGIASGTISSPVLLVFAPAVGYWAGKKVHRKAIEKKVGEKLAGEGDLRAIFRKWNEFEFAPHGFQVWLDVPHHSSERFRLQIAPWDSTMNPVPELSGGDIPSSIAEVPGSEVQRVEELPGSSVSRTEQPSRFTDTKQGEIKHEMPAERCVAELE